jgi:uncharacterized protein YndB with AHSA1/START domain
MSLRILVKPDQIQQWIATRSGTPVRKRGSDAEVGIVFDGVPSDYEAIDFDELYEAMKLHHLVMLVDQEPGKTFHRFYRHG